MKAEIARGISLADAAYGAGFADQSHMTRHFKSRFGLTPGRYAALCASEVAVSVPIPTEVWQSAVRRLAADSDEWILAGSQNAIQTYPKIVLLARTFRPAPLKFDVAPSNLSHLIHCNPMRAFSQGQNDGPPRMNGR